MASAAPHAAIDNPSALPAGTRLEEFEIRAVLGVGGFGIVYLAFDHALEREVAVKEYMPAMLAGRTETQHVSLRSRSDAEIFALGLSSFENEAKLLARFDHPSLLKVHRFWKANGTAYMAMPVMRGSTVKELRQAMTAPPAEAWLRNLLDPLLGAIARLHAEGVYHRDIAPDNIQVETDGHPVLLDFGAARRVISEMTQTLTAILKPAYAPIEQYAEVGAVRQGPWTDIYSLGATLHFLMLGRPPAPATARAVHDEASALTTQTLPEISEDFLRTVDWMLAPRPADRPQSVAELRAVLDGRTEAPRRPIADPSLPSQWERTMVLAPGDGPQALDADAQSATGGPPTGSAAPPAPAPVPSVALSAPLAPGPVASIQPALSTPPLLPNPRVPSAPPWPPIDGPPIAAPPLTDVVSPPRLARRSRALPIALGSAFAVAVAVVLLPRAATGPGTETAASAAGAASAAAVRGAVLDAAPAPAAGAGSAASAGLVSAPESRIATVVVASRRPANDARSARPAPGASSGHPATASELPGGDRKAAEPLAVAAGAGPRSEVAAASAPRVAASGLGSESAPVASASASAPATTPERACAGLEVFAHFVCMERECLRPEFKTHPECLKWHRVARPE